jgi:hypothetical protein
MRIESRNKFKKVVTVALGATLALGVHSAVQAATCTITFDNPQSLAALPYGARDTQVDPTTAGGFPPAYTESCSAGKWMQAETDPRAPWAPQHPSHMYHLLFEAGQCFDLPWLPCGRDMSPTNNDHCNNDACVDTTLYPRAFAPHQPAHYLRVSVQPPPSGGICIDPLTGNTVASGTPNAICKTYNGALFAPLSMQVRDASVNVYFWYYEKVGVATPAGMRYTLASKFSATSAGLGIKTFENYSKKYHMMQVTGVTELGGWSIDDVKFSY